VAVSSGRLLARLRIRHSSAADTPSSGAVFGAMNTMYALVAARTREIGTLRALGFSKVSILTAFVVESTFLAIVGGALGCLLALLANGVTSAAVYGRQRGFS